MRRRENPFRDAYMWNMEHPRLGTRVRYWTGAREGDGKLGLTRSHASVLEEHTAVIWIIGEAACVALSHVEAV